MATTKLSPEAFKRVKVNAAEQERIATPALTFTQDAIRRLKKNKAAVISLWVLIIIGGSLSCQFGYHQPIRINRVLIFLIYRQSGQALICRD